MSDMPKEIWAGWAETRGEPDCWSGCDDGRTKYIRSDITGLQCFYDYEGDLPDKFIAIFNDSSGCNMFYYSHDNQYGERMYTSASDNDYIMGVDKYWFADAGYLWFIALPDNFKVMWDEQNA